MTLKAFGTGLLAATILAAPAMVSAETAARSTECADKTAAIAPLSREDWVAWTKEQENQPAGQDAARKSAKPTTEELAEQYQKLLKQEKAVAVESERPQRSAVPNTSATTGSAAPADGADDPAAETNVPKVSADGSEHYSAPTGGFSSGAHIGNESPTDTGNSAGGMEESKSAERMNMKSTDC